MLTFKIPHSDSRGDSPSRSDDIIFLDDIEIEEKEYNDTFTKPIHDLVADFADKTKPKNPQDLPELWGEPLTLEDMKFMAVKALKNIYYELWGTDDVSKSTRKTLLNKIEWLRNQKTMIS